MELAVTRRSKLGKASQTLRQEGLIPAEIYGQGFKNEHLSIKTQDFDKVFREAGENTIVNLNLEGEKLPTLIYDVQRDKLAGTISHVDFYKVTMTEKIKAKVPLEFVGESSVIKEKLGILNKSMTEVEVEALPADLPHRIEVDLGLLKEVGRSIHANELKIPLGAKVLVDPETVIVTVVPPQKEEEAAPPALDVSEVKVEGEEKKAEREAKKSEEKKE